MPKFPYQRLETWGWLSSPAGKHASGSRPDLLWLHDLRSEPKACALRAEARVFVDWADSRFSLQYPQSLLTAAAIDPIALGQFLTRVSRTLLAIAPPLKWTRHREEIRKRCGPKRYETTISFLLNGVTQLEPMLSSGDDNDLFFARDTDGEAETVDLFGLSYIRYAAPHTGRRIDAAIRHLRSSRSKLPAAKKNVSVDRLAYQRTYDDEAGSRRAWQVVYEEAMRRAVDDLTTFVAKENFNVLDSKTPGQRAFAGACKRIKHMADAHQRFTPSQWWAAARKLHETTEAWEASDIRRHVTRERRASKQIQLTRRVGFVVQYAALMRGNARLRSIAAQIMYLRDICEQIATILGSSDEIPKGSPQKRSKMLPVLAAYDRQVLEAGAEARWQRTLGEHAEAMGRFVESLVTPAHRGSGQSIPWTKGQILDLFRADWPGAKKLTPGSLDDLVVNKCLGPLQRLGLAAQIPEDLWSRAAAWDAAHRQGGDSKPTKPLRTHISKKWIVCPLAALLASRDPEQGA